MIFPTECSDTENNGHSRHLRTFCLFLLLLVAFCRSSRCYYRHRQKHHQHPACQRSTAFAKLHRRLHLFRRTFEKFKYKTTVISLASLEMIVNFTNHGDVGSTATASASISRKNFSNSFRCCCCRHSISITRSIFFVAKKNHNRLFIIFFMRQLCSIM
jgi:hypothetical protein